MLRRSGALSVTSEASAARDSPAPASKRLSAIGRPNSERQRQRSESGLLQPDTSDGGDSTLGTITPLSLPPHGESPSVRLPRINTGPVPRLDLTPAAAVPIDALLFAPQSLPQLHLQPVTPDQTASSTRRQSVSALTPDEELWRKVRQIKSAQELSTLLTSGAHISAQKLQLRWAESAGSTRWPRAEQRRRRSSRGAAVRRRLPSDRQPHRHRDPCARRRARSCANRC